MLMKMTLLGMEDYLNGYKDSLFRDIKLPISPVIDKQALVDNILMECGEMGVLYAEPNFMKYATNVFFIKYYSTFEKWANALEVKYQPLVDYEVKEAKAYTNKEKRIYSEGKKVTKEDAGKTTSTKRYSDTQEKYVEGRVTKEEKLGKNTEKHVEGRVTTEDQIGKTTTQSESYNGAVTTTTTRPNTTSTGTSYAGFRLNDNSNTLTVGNRVDTTIGSSDSNTYNEVSKSEMNNNDKTTNTVIQEFKPHINTTQGDSQNPTTTTKEFAPSYSATQGDKTNPSVRDVKHLTPESSSTETVKPKTTETGHAPGQIDLTETEYAGHTVLAAGINRHSYQELLRAELNIAKFNVYNKITKMFMSELVIAVYM